MAGYDVDAANEMFTRKSCATILLAERLILRAIQRMPVSCCYMMPRQKRAPPFTPLPKELYAIHATPMLCRRATFTPLFYAAAY